MQAKKSMLGTSEAHPAITALERADGPTVTLRGYVGTSGGSSMRLYQDLDTSAYLEIPEKDIVHAEADPQGEPGAVRVFVRASSRVTTARQVSVGELVGRLPPPVVANFWTCAKRCEGAYAAAMSEIRDPADEAFADAQRALEVCLNRCVADYGAPPFMVQPDPTAPGGSRIVQFTVEGLGGIITAANPPLIAPRR
jgi:hypothetical protein